VRWGDRKEMRVAECRVGGCESMTIDNCYFTVVSEEEQLHIHYHRFCVDVITT
jgi:hypothetical protein